MGRAADGGTGEKGCGRGTTASRAVSLARAVAVGAGASAIARRIG
jgi:hypothetical protein